MGTDFHHELYTRPVLANPLFRRFLGVNALFITGMAILLALHWYDIWLWAVYISVWSWAEMKAAHGLALGILGWTVFAAVIITIDLLVIYLTY